MIPDWKGEKLMEKFRKRIKYDDISTLEGHYNATHDKYVYKVYYNDVTTDQLKANILAKNILLQVESEGPHYQLLTKVTYHKRYGSAVTKVNGFTKKGQLTAGKY